MNLPHAKDAILKHLFEVDRVINIASVYKPANVDFATCFVACKEMIADGNINGSVKPNFGRRSETIDMIISESGKYFHTNKSYVKEARRQAWLDFPKNKWWLLDPIKFIIGGICGAIIALSVQGIWSKQLFEKQNIPQQLTPSKPTDTIHHR